MYRRVYERVILSDEINMSDLSGGGGEIRMEKRLLLNKWVCIKCVLATRVRAYHNVYIILYTSFASYISIKCRDNRRSSEYSRESTAASSSRKRDERFLAGQVLSCKTYTRPLRAHRWNAYTSSTTVYENSKTF